MTAYLGTSNVRTFIVPLTPQPDLAVAANYERFDGLTPLEGHSPAAVPMGTAYGDTPRPGQLNTNPADQTYTPGPISSVVSTLGGQPYPAQQWNGRVQGGFTPAPPKAIGGPKRSAQGWLGQGTPGARETVFFAELQSNPPQPGDLASIIAGQG